MMHWSWLPVVRRGVELCYTKALRHLGACNEALDSGAGCRWCAVRKGGGGNWTPSVLGGELNFVVGNPPKCPYTSTIALGVSFCCAGNLQPWSLL